MTTIAELANQVGQGPSDVDGLRQLALDQHITFTKYLRKVLPADGYVFWVRTQSTKVRGSLHVTMTRQQNEDESPTVDRVFFSTDKAVAQFNDVDPGSLWVGEWSEWTDPQEPSLLFAFLVNDSVFEPANLYRYVGTALLPAMRSQLVNRESDLPKTIVVSNSLPLWLGLRSYSPVWLQPPNPEITLYPSYAVPANLRPPYGVVHIEPRGTTFIQAVPYLLAFEATGLSDIGDFDVGVSAVGTGAQSFRGASHYQLASDRVRVTLYGLTNQQALDFMDLVYSYSYDQGQMGIIGTPAVMVDEKRTQPELNILAMKKTLEVEVSYYQARVYDVARQLMLDALPVEYVENPLHV